MIVLEIRRTGATVTNAQVQVNGGLTYGGVLEIVDDSPNPVMAGDRFPLFNATSYSGAFSSLNLPLLPFGLGWTNKLLIDGSIEVVALPPGDRFWTNSLGGNYQYAANLTWIKGRHNFKYGADFLRMQYFSKSYGDMRGRLTFNARTWS
jgi:hypothetical protein